MKAYSNPASMSVAGHRPMSRAEIDGMNADIDAAIELNWRQAAYDAMERLCRNHPEFLVHLPKRRSYSHGRPRVIIVPNYRLENKNA